MFPFLDFEPGICALTGDSPGGSLRGHPKGFDSGERLCGYLHMATNLAIDDALLTKALKIGGKKTKKDTVNEALKEFIVRREQKEVLELFGTVDYFDEYEPKKARRK